LLAGILVGIVGHRPSPRCGAPAHPVNAWR
jgi:hypothetical protein